VRTRAPATTSWVPDVDVADNIPPEYSDDQNPDELIEDSSVTVPDGSTTKLVHGAIITTSSIKHVAVQHLATTWWPRA
jgi:hypothetical protein